MLFILEAVAETSEWNKNLIMALRSKLDETATSMHNDRQQTYRDAAIQTGLSMKVLFDITLRHADRGAHAVIPPRKHPTPR